MKEKEKKRKEKFRDLVDDDGRIFTRLKASAENLSAKE